ncbi:MAG: hypothetical protein E6J79_15645 [Deltaproteobacteria bacterium]|nr:MAG: hypothetical protein E6J79_15645 [Deltaproteobacteria bacterium]
MGPLGGRLLGDQFRGQRVLEVGQAHPRRLLEGVRSSGPIAATPIGPGSQTHAGRAGRRSAPNYLVTPERLLRYGRSACQPRVVAGPANENWRLAMTRILALALAALVTLVPGRLVLAHNERPIASPIRPGPVPDPNRKSAHTIVVCKPSSKPTRAEHNDIRYRLRTSTGAALVLARAQEAAWHRNTRLFKKCRFEHIQAAVNAALNDTTIEVLPGVYREEPSRAAPTTSCGDLSSCAYSYEYHVAHPNDANLIAILGRNKITLEGTGADPHDVLVDVGFAKDVGIRCDKCTGFIVRNLWERDANEHGIYVLDSDGYIFDRTVGSYNGEYSLFSFASDNGLYTDCDAEGGGDSGLYIGGHPDTSSVGRFSCELRRCKMHHSALGFSGTQGTSVWMHDNDFYDNALGISFDSENDHPNFPERKSLIENNLIHDNNFNIYAPTSDVPARGPGYNFFRYPIGTGMWIVGGDDNTIRNNIVWNNQRFGFILASNPTETPMQAKVNRNSFTANKIGVDPDGNPAPNLTAFPPGGDYAPGGSDFFWTEDGADNCWGPQDPASGTIKTDPTSLPGPCPNMNGVDALNPEFQKLLLLAACALVENPPGSGTYTTTDFPYPCPWGHTNDAPYLNGDQQECGNGAVDLGEDCDPGYGGGGSLPETCETLGHGPGTLGCPTTYDSPSGAFLCMWDTSGCAAPACGRAGATKLRLRNLGAPGGDDGMDLVTRNVDGSGRTFDPGTESVSVVVRSDTQLFYLGRIPAGSGGWSAALGRYTYTDPAGTRDGIISIDLRNPAGFGGSFKASVRVRNRNLSGAATARAVTTLLRVGDDCWSIGTACVVPPTGQSAVCRKGALP